MSTNKLSLCQCYTCHVTFNTDQYTKLALQVYIMDQYFTNYGYNILLGYVDQMMNEVVHQCNKTIAE